MTQIDQAFRTLNEAKKTINRRANEIGAIFANAHYKPWVHQHLRHRGLSMAIDSDAEEIIRVAQELQVEDWQRDLLAPRHRSEVGFCEEIQRLNNKILLDAMERDDLRKENAVLHAQLACRGPR